MDDDAARHITRKGLAARKAERVRHRSKVTHRRRDETCCLGATALASPLHSPS
jgi:hypothetical protein